MRNVIISDLTLRLSDSKGLQLPFRIKIEVAKLLGKLGVSVIELPKISGGNDYFLVRALAGAMNECTLALPVDLSDPQSPAHCCEALKGAAHPRLQVMAPVSTVQMEYFHHKKPEAMLSAVSAAISSCKAVCPDVEFVAEDFTRCDSDFLIRTVKMAVEAGATVVSVCDMAGNMLPDEFGAIVKSVREALPGGITLGVSCSNALYLADACAVSAVMNGADQVKLGVGGKDTVSLGRFPVILNSKSESFGARCNITLTELQRSISQMTKLFDVNLAKSPILASAEDSSDSFRVSAAETPESVAQAVGKLGYDLSEEDQARVYEAFRRFKPSAEDSITDKELDAIVATVAFQVPPTFVTDSFVVNTSNVMSSSCHIRLKKGEETLEGVCIGDGPVDAAFLAIDKIVGKHYELDDFQLRSVTRGREAMGETVVKLRHDGKLYSGRGISKNVVEAGIMAYLSAINKITYESQENDAVPAAAVEGSR